MSEIFSPVTGSNRVELVKTFEAKQIIDLYKTSLDIDVSNYFQGHTHIQVYKCLDSQLSFFYPNNIVADGAFYESIQHFSWYYLEKKWEFSQGLQLINRNDKVLEIGSGSGNFLTLLQSITSFSEGLELNESACQESKAKGLNVHLLQLEEFEEKVDKENGLYDVVCSYQVYEHISNIGDIIKSSINILKPGGKLIISVPNNNCLYNDTRIAPLNTPPHHQGLWYPETFKYIGEIFNLKLLNIYYEPVSFINTFRLAGAHSKLKNIANEGQSLQYFRSLAYVFKNNAMRKGRTMLACYTKTI